VRLNSLFDPACDPCTNRLGLLFRVVESLDRRGRAVEYGHGATAIFRVAIDIGQSGRQQPIGLDSDLLRGSVVDPQGIGPTTNIDAERPPGKRLLKNPLTEVTGKEQTVGAVPGERCEEPQLGDPDILSLVDNHEVKRRFVPS
jgi:hypothetical protein